MLVLIFVFLWLGELGLFLFFFGIVIGIVGFILGLFLFCKSDWKNFFLLILLFVDLVMGDFLFVLGRILVFCLMCFGLLIVLGVVLFICFRLNFCFFFLYVFIYK